jgi:hypothetical protein
MSADVETIFTSIVTDRGGLSNFDQTALHVARRVAQMLADDSDLSASALSALMALLPAKPAAGEASYDLSRLTDEEFHLLDGLNAKASNTALPPALFVEPRWPKLSHRSLYITETVLLFDQLEAEIENARRKGQRTDLPVEDLELVRNAVVGLLLDVAQPEQIFSYIAENAIYSERKTWLDREEATKAAAAAAPAVPAPEVKPEAAPQNVVPLWGAFVTKRPHGSGPPWANGDSY